jgi:hypothetical protein
MNAAKCLYVALPGVLVASGLPAATVDFDFSTGDHGWTAGFADYPVGQEAFFELQAELRPRPTNLGGADALFISGNNHSDDLFMFCKRRVGGLLPETPYAVEFDVQFASMYPDGSIGIGGSPANSVYLKAGATAVDPDTVVVDGYYRMNLDKGDQAAGGRDAIVLGDIAKPDDGTSDYVMVSRDNDGSPLWATSDAQGDLWLLFGTDSGFEGTTSLYYTRFQATLTPIPEPAPLALLAAGGLCLAALGRGRRPGA